MPYILTCPTCGCIDFTRDEIEMEQVYECENCQELINARDVNTYLEAD